jgi:hypothetical protein
MPSNVDYLNFEREKIAEEVERDGGVPEVTELEGKKRVYRGGPGRNKIPEKQFTGLDPSGALFNEVEWPAAISSRKHEKYQDRLIAYLHASGMNGRAIAAKLGISASTVYITLALPWVKEAVKQTLQEGGRDAVKEVLQTSAFDTVMFLIDVRNDDKAQTRDRITASKELLDRTYGKPNQPITHREESDLTKLSDEELAKVVNEATSKGNRSN